MNLPVQCEPIERSNATQVSGEKDPTAAMLASGVNPSESGLQPNDLGDILGTIAKIGLPLLGI